MRIRFGTELWPLPKLRPSTHLGSNQRTEILIIGAGTTSAFIAHDLCARGHDVLVVDKGSPGGGSTRACTALIQHELDTPLVELSEKVGESSADYVAKSCLEAVRRIGEQTKELPSTVNCFSRPSLYLASQRSDLALLRMEYELRSKLGFLNEWLTSQDVKLRYPFEAHAATLNRDGLELNPVELTLGLFTKATERGARIMTPVSVARLEAMADGINATTDLGYTIHAKRVIVATGYESKFWLKRSIGKLTSTYAAATPPGQKVERWMDAALVWETARPYVYMRRTVDDRIIIGGRDKPFRNTMLRDLLVPVEKVLLQRRLRKMMTNKSISLERVWAGTFAESDDGMPFMGPEPHEQRIFYVFACGGNGVTFAALAPKLIESWLDGRENRLSKLFALVRDA